MKVASSSTVMDYGSAFDYRSVYSYGRNIYTDNDPYGSEKITAPKSNSRESFQLGSLLSMLATFICYTLVVVTFPVCFFLYLKRVKPFEKAVVFRLGKVRAAEGPGMVLILPFVDRCTIVNLQETDIEVPLQQFLSCDNAVVQCGARIRFRISNPVLYSTSYYDPNHGGLRSLVKSVLLKNGVKHRQKDFEPGSSGIESLSEAISSELNGLVNMWGIDIVTTFMLDVAVLKVAEQQNPVEPVLKSLLGQVGNFPPVSKDTSNALISNLIKLHGGAGPSTACTSATSGKIRSHIDELLSNASNIEKLQLGGVGGILRIDISSPNGTVETVFVDLRGKTCEFLFNGVAEKKRIGNNYIATVLSKIVFSIFLKQVVES